MFKNLATVKPKRVSGQIKDGNVSIKTTSKETKIYAKGSEYTTLSKESICFQLSIKSKEMEVDVKLNAEQLDQLEGAVHMAQERLKGGENE